MMKAEFWKQHPHISYEAFTISLAWWVVGYKSHIYVSIPIPHRAEDHWYKGLSISTRMGEGSGHIGIPKSLPILGPASLCFSCRPTKRHPICFWTITSHSPTWFFTASCLFSPTLPNLLPLSTSSTLLIFVFSEQGNKSLHFSSHSTTFSFRESVMRGKDRNLKNGEDS